jgi:hypothetical protein
MQEDVIVKGFKLVSHSSLDFSLGVQVKAFIYPKIRKLESEEEKN